MNRNHKPDHAGHGGRPEHPDVPKGPPSNRPPHDGQGPQRPPVGNPGGSVG